MTLPLSVIIIVRNEERDLPACLDSIKNIAQEIIVIDSGSSDKTVEIAKQYTSHVYFHEWEGYSAQKQFALTKATSEWILNIDADERVSPELAHEISKTIQQVDAEIGAFKIKFRNFIFHKRLRFGSFFPETHIRLFRRKVSCYGTQQVHEGIQVKGGIGKLSGVIDHYSYASVQEYLTKCQEYTSKIAYQKFQNGIRFHWWHHLRMPYEFIVRYFLKLGFLDGSVGFTYALLSSYYVWLKFLKLKDYEENRS